MSLMIAGGALSARIEDRFAVHQETVVVLTTVERDFEQPTAIGLALHRVGDGIPIIKIANQMHLTGLRGDIDEAHFFGVMVI